MDASLRALLEAKHAARVAAEKAAAKPKRKRKAKRRRKSRKGKRRRKAKPSRLVQLRRAEREAARLVVSTERAHVRAQARHRQLRARLEAVTAAKRHA